MECCRYLHRSIATIPSNWNVIVLKPRYHLCEIGDQEVMMMKTVIVAFTVSEEHSIYYKKKSGDSHAYWEEVGYLLKEAYDKGADFVSVRFIKNFEDSPEIPT